MKKPASLLFLLTAVICMFSGCSKAQEKPQDKKEAVVDKNILIVYLSRTKNTKAVAEIIHKNVGGLLVELELQNPYPEDYKMIVSQVANENETGFLPPLKTKINDMEKYDVIFVGFPTWGMQLPPPMKSFLKKNNLERKTIVPFNTNAGYGIGSTFQTVKELCPTSKILEGFSTKGGMERDGILFVMKGEKEKQVELEVQNWLKKIGFIN
ncbi:flavodoxin family protein [Flavobacterium reichenbachii]|uniref:Flavodoxin n=1 Tax=Flavobacterium reichenbachii TaxID=362418 RepID=A0A085ZEL3_9FLAO|nr:flavodoxin [Flavobacterium reichenbachii]KFF02877.1 flavodoxin [Flavobacterium reichenbachii]OXB16870.1 flavodoxin [Flavobacterium reichenbachii]